MTNKQLHFTIDLAILTPLKYRKKGWSELVRLVMVYSSCSTSGSRRVAFGIIPVMSYDR